MTLDLSQYASERGIKYFMISYTDLFGGQRAKLVPAEAIADMQKDGAGFAGFATWLDLTPAHPDLFAVPDASSVIQLPWKREVAWVAGDLHMEGAPVAQAPRNVLKKVIADAAALGYRMKAGVEPEFHLINADGTAISDGRDTQEKPCYDQSAIMRRYDVIAEICETMIALGWLTIWQWLLLVALFVCDATITLLRRLSRREPIFKAHRLHAYQHLSRRWGSHLRVTSLMLAVNVVILLPLAWTAGTYPALAPLIAIATYALLAIVLWLAGAGSPERAKAA